MANQCILFFVKISSTLVELVQDIRKNNFVWLEMDHNDESVS